ncbi:galactosamine-6-phosphate isomerase [Flavobacteriaceae bacterium]|nr:galactosamine-6-phosphate isomerase [Flavobacteriaceae bacterium]
MKIQYCPDYEEMSQAAFDSIYADLKISSKTSICVATGHSPTGLYEKMVASYHEQSDLYSAMQFVKLDEWLGVSADDPNSCEYYIQNKIILPLNITEDRYLSFISDAVVPEEECKRVQKELDKYEALDVCVLGLGRNGHLGFNEPAATLSNTCHISPLTETSMQHSMTKKMTNKPKYGLTLGMADILRSKKIILLVTGVGKEATIAQLLTQQITSQLPASFLWNHPNAECYIDSESL